MTIHFSPSSISFYDEKFKEDYEKADSWPEDLVVISSTEHNHFINASPNLDETLGSKDGKPAWVKIVNTLDEIILIETKWRDTELTWARDELELVQDGRGIGTEKQWRSYRNALRDYTENNSFPNNARPESPKIKNTKQEK